MRGMTRLSPSEPLTRCPLGALRIVVVISLVLLGAGKDQARIPSVYELPDGYRGWVLIRFEGPGCDPIPTESENAVFRIPSNGVLCTSSPLRADFDWENDEYYFVGAGRTAIPPVTQAGDGPKVQLLATTECFVAKGVRGPTFLSFFVGTANDAKNDRSMPQPCAKRASEAHAANALVGFASSLAADAPPVRRRDGE